jgi:UDP-glucose 4-epimerase
LGAENVIRAALANEVKKCVVLSTDKAVYPINAMGISKAMMEKVMVAHARLADASKTVLCATRYGNVMGSRGSVIPLFMEQLRAGKPLTITDPKMTRFLMSLEESVELVLYAFMNAKPGDIFVQKAPAATIENLATAMTQLFGAQSKNASTLKVIGTRHGEKLYETLVSREEMARAQEIDGYFRIPADGRDLNYAQYYSEGEVAVSQIEDYTSHNTQLLDVEQVKVLLQKQDWINSAA